MAYLRGPEALQSPAESIDEEANAYLLGILIERDLGFDWRYTWELHNWSSDSWHGVRPAMRELRKRGLIRGLTPTRLLNATSSTPSR